MIKVYHLWVWCIRDITKVVLVKMDYANPILNDLVVWVYLMVMLSHDVLNQ